MLNCSARSLARALRLMEKAWSSEPNITGSSLARVILGWPLRIGAMLMSFRSIAGEVLLTLATLSSASKKQWTMTISSLRGISRQAAIAQLGERQADYLKVPGSIPGLGKN